MLNKFIYVFSKEDKDELLANGYLFLREVQNVTTPTNTYVFENKPGTQFSLLDKSKYMSTNTLMF